MIHNLYSVQDTLIGFTNPEIQANDEAAKRGYMNFLKTCKNPSDMRLYRIGTFDDSTGTIIGETPVQLMGGGEGNEV